MGVAPHRESAGVRAGPALLLPALLLGALLSGSRVAAAGGEPAPQEGVMEVVVNGQSPGETVIVLRDDAGGLWLDGRDLAKFHLRAPDVAPFMFQGHSYFAISALPGGKVDIDEATASAQVTVGGDAFEFSHRSAAPRPGIVIAPASLGAFFNYQLSDQRYQDTAIGGGLAELGLFGPAGVLTNDAVARFDNGSHELVRLDSTFTVDFPQRLETLQFGDIITDSGSWGSAVHAGGVRWGTNFALRPDLLTLPLLATSGTAVLPSSVDVFVNGQRVATQNVPPGPFVVDRLPALTGGGNVTLVVRDELGREQIISQPFYSSATMLAAGLSQYGVALAVARDDYGVQSNRYAGMTGEATYRHGVSDFFTLEGHGEFLGTQAHAAGVDAVYALGHFGVLDVALAEGGGNGTNGVLSSVSIQHQSGRLTAGISSAVASSGYRQVSDVAAGANQFRERNLAQIGWVLGHGASVQVAYADETFPASSSQRTLTMAYSQELFDSFNLSVTATRSESPAASSSVFVFLTRPLGARRSVTTGGSWGSGAGAPPNEVNVQYVESPPVGPGYGYRVGVSSAGNYNADGRWQSAAGDLDAQVVRNEGVTGQSATWSGAFTLMDGTLRATRQVSNSFAEVDVDGLAGIPVYVDNQLMTTTDANGHALLYNMLPYQVNHVSIDPTELPLDAEIGARALTVAPPYRSGVKLEFPVHRIRAGVFRLVTSDGSPLPTGAVVDFKGENFPIGLDGQAYVTGFDHGFGASASWPGHRCYFRIEPPPSDDPQPDMGTIVCTERSADQGHQP